MIYDFKSHVINNYIRNMTYVNYILGPIYFTNRVVDYWNSLPNCVVTANNTNVFKRRLDQYWQHQDIIGPHMTFEHRLKGPEVAVMYLE